MLVHASMLALACGVRLAKQRDRSEASLRDSSTACTMENVLSGTTSYVICPPGEGVEAVIAEALKKKGMHVRLTAGEYVTNMWIMEEGTTLEGADIWTTTIYKTPDSSDTRPVIRSGSSSPSNGEAYKPPGPFMTTSNLTIANLLVDGSRNTLSSGFGGIDIRNIVGLDMYKVGVRNVKGTGVNIRGSRKPLVRPVEPEDTPGYECRDITMDTLRIENVGGHGISLSDFCTNIEIKNSKVTNADKSGINCSRCQSVHRTNRSRIHGNIVEYQKESPADVGHPTTYAGIRLSNDAILIDVENNSIYNMSRGIFLVSGSRYNNIGDNTIHGPERNAQVYSSGTTTSEGIFVQTPFNTVFCNTVAGADFEGIYIDGGHGGAAMEDSGFQVHNDQNVVRHNLVSGQCRVSCPSYSEGGVFITSRGTALRQTNKTFGNIIKYTSSSRSEFDSTSAEYCSTYSFTNRANGLVTLRGFGPYLVP